MFFEKKKKTQLLNKSRNTLNFMNPATSSILICSVSWFMTKNFVCISCTSHMCYMLYQSQPPWSDNHNIWWEVQIVKLHLYNFLQPPPTSSLSGLQHSPQCPVFKHSAYVHKNYSSVYFSLYIFGLKTGRQKTMTRTVPGTEHMSSIYTKKN